MKLFTLIFMDTVRANWEKEREKKNYNRNNHNLLRGRLSKRHQHDEQPVFGTHGSEGLKGAPTYQLVPDTVIPDTSPALQSGQSSCGRADL